MKSRYATLATLACIALGAGTAAAQTYTESICATPYATITANPAAIRMATASGCDDCTESLTMAAAFNWYGPAGLTPKTTVQVASNGQVNMNSTDTDANCCSADAVQVGGAYLLPRIAVVQDDLYPPFRTTPSGIWKLVTATSTIIEWRDISWYFTSTSSMNAQVELTYATGQVEIRYGTASGQLTTDQIACGVEDDTRAPAQATACTGVNFGAGGLTTLGTYPTTQCHRFSAPVATPTPTPTPTPTATPTPGGTCGCIADANAPTVNTNIARLETKLDTNAVNNTTQNTNIARLETKLDSNAAHNTVVDTNIARLETKLDTLTTVVADVNDLPCQIYRLLSPRLPGKPDAAGSRCLGLLPSSCRNAQNCAEHP